MDEEFLEVALKCVGPLGIIIGTFTGLELSFTSLSPLVIGGIIGSIPAALALVMFVGTLLYTKFYKKDSIDTFSECMLPLTGAKMLVSAAIGVGLAAAAIAIVPGAMLGAGPAFLTSAAIGIITPTAVSIVVPIAILVIALAASAIVCVAEKVNKHVISPIVNKVSECFSSKEQGVKAN